MVFINEDWFPWEDGVDIYTPVYSDNSDLFDVLTVLLEQALDENIETTEDTEVDVKDDCEIDSSEVWDSLLGDSNPLALNIFIFSLFASSFPETQLRKGDKDKKQGSSLFFISIFNVRYLAISQTISSTIFYRCMCIGKL